MACYQALCLTWGFLDGAGSGAVLGAAGTWKIGPCAWSGQMMGLRQTSKHRGAFPADGARPMELFRSMAKQARKRVNAAVKGCIDPFYPGLEDGLGNSEGPLPSLKPGDTL